MPSLSLEDCHSHCSVLGVTYAMFLCRPPNWHGYSFLYILCRKCPRDHCLPELSRNQASTRDCHLQSQPSCPALPSPPSVLTNIDPTMLHRSWDGSEEPAPKAQALVVEVSHNLMTFTIDARGSKGTCHQG